jgi:hypothetical protein
VEVNVQVNSFPLRDHEHHLNAILELMDGVSFGPVSTFEGGARLVVRILAPLSVSLSQVCVNEEVCVRALLHNRSSSALRINEIRLDRPLRDTACLPPTLPVCLASGDQYCMLLSARASKAMALNSPAVLISWSMSQLFAGVQILSRHLCPDQQRFLPQTVVVRVRSDQDEQGAHRAFPVRQHFSVPLTLSYRAESSEPLDLFLFLSARPFPPLSGTRPLDTVDRQLCAQPRDSALVCVQHYLHVGELSPNESLEMRAPLFALSEGVFSLYTQLYDRASNRFFGGGKPAQILCRADVPMHTAASPPAATTPSTFSS